MDVGRTLRRTLRNVGGSSLNVARTLRSTLGNVGGSSPNIARTLRTMLGDHGVFAERQFDGANAAQEPRQLIAERRPNVVEMLGGFGNSSPNVARTLPAMLGDLCKSSPPRTMFGNIGKSLLGVARALRRMLGGLREFSPSVARTL